jgi:hypothetical protein
MDEENPFNFKGRGIMRGEEILPMIHASWKPGCSIG